MYITGESIDDLLHQTYKKILKGKTNIVKATKGVNKEIIGAMLLLKDPRARISRSETKGTIFSCLGELLWYLSASSDLEFIKYYIDGYDQYAETDGSIHGAYGPRIFQGSNNQFQIVKHRLIKNAGTRKAVIQVFDARDILKDYHDVPCTCSLQFFIRNSKLDLVVHMRSSDAYKGLPHDIFAFTMFQEIMARDIGCEVGTYKHISGSLHLYEPEFEKAQAYINEGHQSKTPMPPMPIGSPWPSIHAVLDFEKQIRKKTIELPIKHNQDDYWGDIISLLAFYANSKEGKNKPHDNKLARKIMEGIHSDIYFIYLEKRNRRDIAQKNIQPQVDLFDSTLERI